MIQGEILSTAFTRDFALGVQRFAWAENLLMASSQGVLNSGSPLPNPLDSTKAGTAPIAFTDFYRIFPNFVLDGSTITGNLLTNQALLQYQATFSQSNTKVLLQPRLLVKNQQSSTIFVGEEVPYLTTYTDSSTVNNGGTSGTNPYRTTTQQTVTSGLRFDVTPSISNSYLVELDLAIDNDKAVPTDIPDGGETRSAWSGASARTWRRSSRSPAARRA
jgi:type II secretory pathway component GspD/PulD (secretin)